VWPDGLSPLEKLGHPRASPRVTLLFSGRQTVGSHPNKGDNCIISNRGHFFISIVMYLIHISYNYIKENIMFRFHLILNAKAYDFHFNTYFNKLIVFVFYSIFWCNGQLIHSCSYVLLLWIICPWTTHAEILMVETLLNNDATGNFFSLQYFGYIYWFWYVYI